MNKQLRIRLLSLILAAVMAVGLFPAVSAAPGGLRWEMSDVDVSLDRNDRLIRDVSNSEDLHTPTDLVRVSILLEDKPTLQRGFSTMGLGSDPAAAAADLDLLRTQKAMEQTISAQALDGKPLDVVWNLTLVCNLISANVPYGKLDAIRSVPGVRDVILERQYEADTAQTHTASSSAMTGASILWQTGLTGAGTRIAVIDTGTDTDHQSFDSGAYLHALAQNAAAAGLPENDYLASLDLLDAAEISLVLERLNAYERIGGTAEQYYINEKLPFGANYVDCNLTINHDFDYQGSHGSHVAGIAAANRYIPQGGGYADALSSVHVSGVAPDAQILTMKVFGNADGPFDSDYFAAIEDALWLGCDSVNLSLGSGSPGASGNPLFSGLLEYMATTDTVVVMSAGNSGNWAQATTHGYLYDDGVSFQTAGAPGTYTNSLAVASVENDGSVGNYLDVAGRTVVYTETFGYYNQPMTSLDNSPDGSGTAYDYIFTDGLGQTSDYEGLDLFGKVVFCARGDLSFTEKATNAARLGAAAVVVYNNTSGPFGMDLSDYRQKAPCVSILKSDADAIRESSHRQTTEGGLVYYTGTVTVSRMLGVSSFDSEYYTISPFSSWGVPGSLELKPEITAPGGNIWSVNGMDTSGTGYELMSGTSMAAPQVAGMAALVSEYIRANGLDEKTGLSVRQLAQSLLMSTAQPMKEEASGGEYYSILAQGAGLARVDLAASAESYILVDGMPDGKVKAELGEDAGRDGIYRFTFSIHDLSGQDRTYALSADLFTQGVFDGGDGTMYLDTWTRPLTGKTEFFSGGVSLECADSGFSRDLNGDGITNSQDADHLLEYLVGNADALHADGDVSGDGTVSSYDAHVLLTRLSGSYRVEVPAGGCAEVEVLLELTGETRALLESEYPAGAYIEAFVHAQPLSDAEGSVGVAHSIPVLGYYGSWTEPSMFDVGSYPQLSAEDASRVPYLYDINGIETNYLSICYGGREEYAFGGNPIVREDTYLPRRNAFNNQKGWTLQNLRFTLIRNAPATRLLVSNADTGEIYLSHDLGQMEGAYYHTNAGAWQNTQKKLGLGLELSHLREGTRVNVSLIAAPELYCTYDPATERYTADWEALGDGAYLTTGFTIDNTAPKIKSVELGENNTLRITASDGEYIAAAALMNTSGTGLLAAAPANQTERGKEVTIELDLSHVYGSEFLVAVYDYAENAAVCAVTLELDTQRPYFTVIDCGDDSAAFYTGLDAEGSTVRLAASERGTPVAAEYAEGAVFEITEDGRLWAAFHEDLYRFTCLSELDPAGEWEVNRFLDLAYNRLDGMLYSLFYSWKNNQTVPYLCSIDPYTGEMTVLGQMPVDVCTIAIDGSGNFYSTAYGASQLYRYRSDVTATNAYTLAGQTGGYRSTELTSLAWDHNTDCLYWAYNAGEVHYLVELNINGGTPRLVCKLNFPARGLYIAYAPENDRFAPTDAVTAVTMDETAHTLAGSNIRLIAQVLPWNVSDSSLIWSSSDSTVASVDENGLVTGLKEGTAVITAASRLDSAVSASCTVTVTALDTLIKGLIWDETGEVWWGSFVTGSIPAWDKLRAVPDNLPLNATMMANGTLYASALDTNTGLSELYAVDPATFDMTLVGPASTAYLDMAYAPSLGCGVGVYFNYVVLIDLQTGEYMGAWDWSGGMTADLVGITYYGSEYSSAYETYLDYFLILDADGNVYLDAWITTESGTGYFLGPIDGYTAAIGDPVDYSYFQGFHYDGSYVYWTRFCEADNRVELIAWDCDNSGEAYSLGYFDEGIWPVGGLYTDGQLSGSMALAMPGLETAAVKELLQAQVPAGSLNAAAPQTDAEELVHVSLAVPDAALEPTNCTLTVTFDPSALELVSATGSCDAFAWRLTQENTVAIAFADRAELVSAQTIAQLHFRPLGLEDTTVTVSYGQWNQWSLAAVEEYPVVKPKPHMPFTDVPDGSFYHIPVLWAIGNGITTGATETTFDPNGDCLRASVVTFLWRASGCPEPASDRNPFADVKESDFFYKAVLWAVEKGITNGTAADTFSPYAKCNRAQVVTFLWRAMGQPDPVSRENPFSDVTISQFYGTAVLWAVEMGITNGMGDGTFGVNAVCNRAQVVTFLYRTMKQ